MVLLLLASSLHKASAQTTQPSDKGDDLTELLQGVNGDANAPAPASPPPADQHDAAAAAPASASAPEHGEGAVPAEAPPAVPATAAVEKTAPIKVKKANDQQQSDHLSGNRLVEEIIVTAEKREEDIKDVPISISSFNADYLSAKGVFAQQDLPKITPGLTFSAPTGFATAFIRGIGSDAYFLADPLVVTYIDGVYFPSSTTQFQDFGTVEKIEIDKGPQGTLFGRNALGGVIAITTTDPSLTDVQATANTTYTNYTGSDPTKYSLNTSGSVSVPITDTLGISFAGLFDRDNPYYNDTAGPTGNIQPIDSGHSWAFRAKVLWKPTSNSKIKLNVYRFHESDPQRNFDVASQPSLLAVDTQPQNPFNGGYINQPPLNSSLGLTYFGSGDLNTYWVDIQVLGSYQKITALRNTDFDGTALPVAYFEATNQAPINGPFFADSHSAELRLLSTDNVPSWLKLVGGIYYFNQDSGIRNADFQATDTNLQQGVIAGVSVPGLQSLFTPLTTLLPLLPQGVELALRGGLNDDSIAGYAQGTVNFTDWMALTLGARYQSDERYILFEDQGVDLNDQTQVIIFHYSGVNDNKLPTPVIGSSVNSFNHNDYRTHTNSFDPKGSLNFHPGDGWLGTNPLLYVNYQTATVDRVFNVISLFSAPNLAQSSKLTAYEGGLKTTLFDNLVSVDAAGFYYKEKDAQTEVISLQTGGAVHFENVPGLQTIGADLSILAEILPSLTNDGLVFTLGAAYLDSTYTDYPDASGFDTVTGVYSSTNDYTGHKVVQTPKYTTSVGLNQTFRIPGGPLEAGVDFYYNSGFYFLAQNTPNTQERAYRTLGFTLSYLYEPWKTRITAFGHNVLNEHYYDARVTDDFGTTDYPAQLSTYGVSLHWNY